MKQKFLIFAALAALVAGVTACNKQETPASDDSRKQGFEIENVVVDITLSQDNTKASITLKDIRFSDQMPLLITLRIPDVPVTRQGESIRFNWNDTENAITPIAIVRGQESAYDAYKVTTVNGAVEPDPKDGTKKVCNLSSIAFVGTNPEKPANVTTSFQGNVLENLQFKGTFRVE